MRLLLHEGIPTSLKNERTGQHLEIVLMLANSRVYNYFCRMEGSRDDGSSPPTPPADADACASLNVAGNQFVQRHVFETSPDYRVAYAMVKKHWWKYVLVGRLAVLAMAKQKRLFD